MEYRKIALKSVIRHPKRTVILIALQGLLIAILILGYSLVSEARTGLKTEFRQSFTGDGFIRAQSKRPIGLFGDMTPFLDGFHEIDVIPDFSELSRELDNLPQIEAYVPLLTGMVEMRFRRDRNVSRLFGVNFQDYASFFNELPLMDGNVPLPGDKGALVPVALFNSIENRIGRRPVLGENIVLTHYIDGGFRIREVPIAGVLDYPGESDELSATIIVDTDTLRYLLEGFTVRGDIPTTDTDSNREHMLTDDMDDLFEEDYYREEKGEASVYENFPEFQSVMSPSQVERRLQVTPPETNRQFNSDEWHFILIRFAGNKPPGIAVRMLRKHLADRDIHVGSWREAAGITAVLVLSLQIVLTLGFVLIVLAGVIAAVNAHVVSVTERSSEIGTLRALGAQRKHIILLIFTEIQLISIVAGLLGAILAMFVSYAIEVSGIIFNNTISNTLFGGTSLSVPVSVSSILLGFVASIILGLFSSLYPLSLTLAIQPSRAMARD